MVLPEVGRVQRPLDIDVCAVAAGENRGPGRAGVDRLLRFREGPDLLVAVALARADLEGKVAEEQLQGVEELVWGECGGGGGGVDVAAAGG